MRRILSFFLVFCLCLNLTGCRSEGQTGETGESEKVPEAELDKQALEMAGQYLEKMTLEEKIGQMFLVDVDKLLKGGRAVTASSPELLQAIERYKVGGIMLGRGNVQSTDQVKSLINDIQQATGENGNLTIPLYIGTEEEGGGEKSIAASTETITSTGYVSPAEMGKNMTESQLENTGEVIAGELAGLGFNLNLAPTADVAGTGQPADEQAGRDRVIAVIGKEPVAPNTSGRKISKAKRKKKWKAYRRRLKQYNAKYDALVQAYSEARYNDSCFSEDGEKVGEAVSAMVKGMHTAGSNGICTVLKMFPGISAVAGYHKLVGREIDTGLSRLRRENLAPFSAGIDAGTDAIMVGHVTVSKVDSSAPASLSKTIMMDMLRDEMGFDGIVLTEQMDVPAITEQYTTDQAVRQAITSGADMIYNPEDLEVAISSIRQAVMAQEIEEKVIDQAVLRILHNKLLRGICKGTTEEGATAQ